jgi:adenine-specific DNA-methyltransferase
MKVVFGYPAHVEILADLALSNLTRERGIAGFDDLQRAWAWALDTAELNRRFYREIANWYFWAVDNVTFPDGAGVRADNHNATSVIRLLTRLIFVWFLKERDLVPEALFRKEDVEKLLHTLDPDEGSYYRAILQNLFFATLNQEMNTPERPKNRHFRNDGQHHNATALYRYRNLLRQPDELLQLLASMPFLNGGLFECLDKNDEQGKVTRVDGFSDRPDNPLHVPNRLFFSQRHVEDLNRAYGTRGKRYTVRGLVEILDSYKFTVAENTPIEQEIALDPELIGQVFENLLAAYNPETETTARKETGSLYTPRAVVEYMVDESLVLALRDYMLRAAPLIPAFDVDLERLDDRLRTLLAYTDAPHGFSADETLHLIAAIDTITILDPACGSGAFPMGMLQKLVYVLSKLDPGNRRWMERQLARARSISNSEAREAAETLIEEAFGRNELDYGRKLFLIENCIYGVDIQPIAVQIAKLRCFIALIVDQRVDNTRLNRGVRALPNLETKFVAANALRGIPRPQQLQLRDAEIEKLEQALDEVRSHHFNARTTATKRKYRAQDRDIRAQLAVLLQRDGFSDESAALLAGWNPYDQNATAAFFDTEWMFGKADGFHIVIANPPHVGQEQIREQKLFLQQQFPEAYTGTADLYVYFFCPGAATLTLRGRADIDHLEQVCSR